MPVNPLPLVLYIFLFASSRANTKKSMIICRFIFTGVVACCFWLGGFLVWLFRLLIAKLRRSYRCCISSFFRVVLPTLHVGGEYLHRSLVADGYAVHTFASASPHTHTLRLSGL